MNRITLCLALSLATVACDGASTPSDGGPPGEDAGSAPACGAPGRTGETSCEVAIGGTCPARQYCDMAMLTCTPGCTSDDNCGANERCARAAGEAFGVCEACPTCGNGTCDAGEDEASCAADCATGPTCGDGSCDAGETPTSCPADCATGPTCGDGSCDAGETPSSCPADCDSGPTCGDGSCDAGETSASCPADCASGPTCGDGTCDAGESYESCPADCGSLGLEDCFETCNDYAFFECVASAADCNALCDSATPSQRESFLSCAEPVVCSTYEACLPRLE